MNITKPLSDLKKSPVAFFIFNRPEITKLVFNQIRKYKPDVLLIIADGPTDIESNAVIEQTRKIINDVDWDCQVLKNFSENNLGCKKRVSSGLKWVFDHVTEAIILEDDCLPCDDFFNFCNYSLNKYKNNKNIMHVSGTACVGWNVTPHSYWYSRHSDIWGWATWKRAFMNYDPDILDWPKFRRKQKRIWRNPIEREYWVDKYDQIFSNHIDTWDFQWHYTLYKMKGLAVVPKINLISNIGVGVNATHCKNPDHGIANLKTGSMGTINAPRGIKKNHFYDDYLFSIRYKFPSSLVHNDL